MVSQPRCGFMMNANDTCVCGMQMDDIPIGNAPVIPEGGRRHLLSGGISTFAVISISPSTPGPHPITGLFHAQFKALLRYVSIERCNNAETCP